MTSTFFVSIFFPTCNFCCNFFYENTYTLPKLIFFLYRYSRNNNIGKEGRVITKPEDVEGKSRDKLKGNMRMKKFFPSRNVQIFFCSAIIFIPYFGKYFFSLRGCTHGRYILPEGYGFFFCWYKIKIN